MSKPGYIFSYCNGIRAKGLTRWYFLSLSFWNSVLSFLVTGHWLKGVQDQAQSQGMRKFTPPQWGHDKSVDARKVQDWGQPCNLLRCGVNMFLNQKIVLEINL